MLRFFSFSSGPPSRPSRALLLFYFSALLMVGVDAMFCTGLQGEYGRRGPGEAARRHRKVQGSDDGHRGRPASAAALLACLLRHSFLFSMLLSSPSQHHQSSRKLTFKNSWILPRSSWLSCVMNFASSRGQKALSCWAEGESDDDVGIAAAICCCSCSPWAGEARCLARTASRSDITVRAREGG